MIPGELFIKDGEIEINKGRKGVTLSVSNTGDRPIQVGSHYHFFETNPALKFERKKARGMRLDIPAGTAVRFEPGPDARREARGARRHAHRLRLPAGNHGTAGKRKAARIMTSELAQARPSRSQRCYRGWDQDQISVWRDAGSGFNTGQSDLGDLSHLVEPNASDLKVRIPQKRRDASKSVHLRTAAMQWG